MADAIETSAERLLEANASDLAALDEQKRDAKYDRLLLNGQRIAEIAATLRSHAALPSPIGVELSRTMRPNGLLIRKVSVPFGVIGSIYEARPSITFNVFGLCFKAGSAVLLKGGHVAHNTNVAAVNIIRETLEKRGIDPDAAIFVGSDRSYVMPMLEAAGQIDLLIPRGGYKLMDFVRRNARVPVLMSGAGVCHTYFHSSGDIATGRDIIYNAKTRRVSACNALDCLVVDRDRLDVLPALCYHLADGNVAIHADPESYEALDGAYPYLFHAQDEDFGREWFDYRLTIKTVDGIDEALRYIERHGSHLCECIIAENKTAADRFLREVDAACVYVNVSTAFTDGGQFGLGAEIAISTQKMHARGPMALSEITTYKYLITGSGQTRG